MQQIKAELKQRRLSTTGNKAELQIRLRGAMELEGLDPENHEFDVKDQTMVVPAENVTGNGAPDNNFDMGQLLAVMKRTLAEQQTAEQNSRQEQNSKKIERALADQTTKQEEIKQALTQQIMEQNKEMKQALADQSTRQDQNTAEMQQSQKEIKQALVEQKTELKD